MFSWKEGNNIIAQYDLTTPWDVTSMQSTSVQKYSSDESSLRNIQLDSDGTILYVGG